ncbi:MAG: type II/IV secretion system protein [Alphaproteobacteria bacterium]|nr:type II/IV secretion system protein [Alphaproteobacteria bacterium]
MPAPTQQTPRIGGEVIRLLDNILAKALDARASDVHVEPKEHLVRIRFRVDGVMVEQRTLPTSYAASLLSRIKVLAKMDIAEKRLPQDGTFKAEPEGRAPVAVRASTFPSVWGEKAVLRLLVGAAVMPLQELGCSLYQSDTLRRLVQRPGGLLLVTGPTGSGKTSTLYALLDEVDTEVRNVVTLEDPIEVELNGITQGQVHPKAGFDFSRGLRAILRQDPDVILVGEMRDLETANIAVQAGLTGHLVLSTLHTNSAAETMLRLVDMGVEAYTVANALIGVVAQRLVRTLCHKCSTPGQPPAHEMAELGPFALDLTGARQAVGCEFCMGTGYRGRTGIYDVVVIDEDLRTVIKSTKSTKDIKEVLRQKQLPTLRETGLELVQSGLTTLTEVLRVT